MFEELLSNLNAWENKLRGMPRMTDLGPKLRANVAMCAEAKLRKAMLKHLEDAIGKSKEYLFPGFAEKLRENFRSRRHYYVSNDLTTIQVIDRQYAGTYSDFRQGQIAAWGPKTATASRSERAAVWKWGIYKPAREGMTLYKDFITRFGDLPSYSEIIETRFRVWGEKVPYWYFLNYGTGDLAYPAFGGYNFVEKTKLEVPRIINECTKQEIEEFKRDIGFVAEKVLSWETGTKTETHKVYGEKISIIRHVEETGLVWYQLRIGGSFRERVYPGRQIVVGEKGTGVTFREY